MDPLTKVGLLVAVAFVASILVPFLVHSLILHAVERRHAKEDSA